MKKEEYFVKLKLTCLLRRTAKPLKYKIIQFLISQDASVNSRISLPNESDEELHNLLFGAGLKTKTQ